MSNFVSPNDMLSAAKKLMLGGKEPSSRADWMTVINFVAFNVAKEARLPACKLFAKLFDIPLEVGVIEKIVQYQNRE